MSRRPQAQYSSSRDDRRSISTKRTAAELDRDARDEAGNLKNILTGQFPWTREAEQSRQKCRELHLLLIFQHPLSPYSQSLDNLWHQTSYLLISSYRNIISNLEKSLVSTSSPPRRNNGGGRSDNSNSNGQQQSELRKCKTRFKQYLSTEDSFYKSLISRIFKHFNLSEIHDLIYHLQQAKIPLSNNDTYNDQDEEEEQLERRNSHSNLELERRDKMNLIYKALICLGDLERYKEQYPEQSKSKNNNNGRRGNTTGGEEKFSESRKYYEIARSLKPDDGSAFNQLAVISTYLSDPFSTTYYYFRASAVRNAFKGIDGIIYDYLGKATEKWRAKRKEEKGREEELSSLDQVDDIKKWKEDMVVLVAILYLKAGFSFIPALQPTLLEQFYSFLRSRRLSTEVIVKTVIIAIGLHHHARNTAGIEEDPKLLQRSHEAELRSLELLLSISEILIRTASEEIEDIRSTLNDESALDLDNDDDDYDHEDNQEGYVNSNLYQYISAILRRILPSLRIISKWIKFDLDYLLRQSQSQNKHNQSTASSVDSHKRFWTEYKRLIDNLSSVFPIHQLPSSPEPLEEDLDMKGFLPLQRGITNESGSGNTNEMNNGLNPQGGGEVHPNEEQLMRLADIQVDARLIMQSGVGSALLGNQPVPLPLPTTSSFNEPREQESDIASVSTETEDDPVNMAMRATLASESSIDGDEEVDEVIVWNKSPAPAVPFQPNTSSASVPLPTPSTKKPTAYDLLQNLMLESTPTPPSHTNNLPHLPNTTTSPAIGSPHLHSVTATASTPVAGGLLFGSSTGGQVGMTGNNIWTMTREESEKGQKRNSGVGQPNIAAIWGNPTTVETSNNNNSSIPPPPATSYYGHTQAAVPPPPQVSSVPAPASAHATVLNTSFSPQSQHQQHQQYYTHNSVQSSYPYQHHTQSQAHAQAQFSQSTNPPRVMSNIPLPLPLPQQPVSPAYPYDQNPTQTSQNQQVPYYLQPAYYASKPYGNGNWGTGAGNGNGT